MNVQVGTGFTSAAAGAAHTIARAVDGSLWGFGSNPIGQLGTSPYLLVPDAGPVNQYRRA